MSKTKKRRVKKTRPHQTMKPSGSVQSINWTRILLIVIGILIAASMILSMVVVPGT
jgi:hypothetical protein